MTNPIIQTDIAEVLREIRNDQKEMLKEMRSSDKAILDEMRSMADEMRSSDKAILDEMRSSNKAILEKINNLEIGQAQLKEKFEAQGKIVAGLESSQNKQIWALIALAFTAVVSLLVGLGKFIFFPNP